MNQVLEHFIYPGGEIRELRHRVRPDGVLFVSTPNSRSVFRKLTGKKWINWHVPYHQHHFSKKSLTLMLVNSGWRLESIRTVTPLVWCLLQFRQRRSRPSLGTASRSWNGVPTRLGRALEITLLIFIFLPVRIIDLLGQGDSLVITARRVR